MKIKLETTNLAIARKNKKLMRVLYSLTLCGVSEMRNQLNNVSDNEYWSAGYKIILAKTQNKIVGWGLIFPHSHLDLRDWPNFKRANNYKAYFYVSVKYRRMKVGSTLLKKAQKMVKEKRKRLLVDSWDEYSFGFFNYNGMIK